MAVSYFSPVAGQNDPFGNIGAQNYNILQTNLATEAANIGRVNEAQRLANLTRAADINRADRERGWLLDLGLQGQTNRYQRYLDERNRGDTLAYQNRALGISERAETARERDRTDADAEAERTAEFFKEDAYRIGQEFKAAKKAADEATADFDRGFATVNAKVDPNKVKFDRVAKRFTPNSAYGTTDDEKKDAKAAADAAQDELAEYAARYHLASADYTQKKQEYDGLRASLRQTGLDLAERSGKHVIFNPRSNKTYSFAPPSGPPAPDRPPPPPPGTTTAARTPAAPTDGWWGPLGREPARAPRGTSTWWGPLGPRSSASPATSPATSAAAPSWTGRPPAQYPTRESVKLALGSGELARPQAEQILRDYF